MSTSLVVESRRTKRPCSDGNIRYYEYENDKFEYLSEYKSGDPQRGLAFVPRRGINVSRCMLGITSLIAIRCMRMKS